jgi:uncharacterized iron-regulated protein
MTRAPLGLALALIGWPFAVNGADINVPPDAQIVVLGEIHDNPAHHAEQARVVAEVRPKAVVWEMLSPAQWAAAQAVDRTDAAAFEAALGWEAAGWPDFSMYHPIFLAAGQATHVPAAVPRDLLRRAMADGALAALPPQSASLFDVTRALPALTAEDQAAREAEQAAAHCNALPDNLLPGMVEAQRLRDAAMAAAALEALADFGPPVVIITGSGHARTDVGIPAMIRAARPDVSLWSLGQLEADPGPGAPYDAIHVTDPTPRDDPCAAFQ